MIKWMLSKGQGRTHGTYFTLLNALAEDGRLEEAEELWTKLFTENLESTPRMFFDKMVSIYYKRDMDEKLFEVFLALNLVHFCWEDFSQGILNSLPYLFVPELINYASEAYIYSIVY